VALIMKRIYAGRYISGISTVLSMCRLNQPIFRMRCWKCWVINHQLASKIYAREHDDMVWAVPLASGPDWAVVAQQIIDGSPAIRLVYLGNCLQTGGHGKFYKLG
jgi:hypothetical protein